jgi:hypothetical protein
MNNYKKVPLNQIVSVNIDTEHNKTTKSKCGGETPVIMLISTALLLDS